MMQLLGGTLVTLGLVGSLSACSAQASMPTEATGSATATPVPALQPAMPAPTVASTPSAAAAELTPSPSDAPQQAIGVVVAVDGDLSEIRAFAILQSDGKPLELTPQAGLLFDGGPLAHLRDHMVSGVPISVEFHSQGGVAIATSVGDAE